MPVHSPATGAELTSIANGTESDVDRAVQAARASYEGVWGRGKTTVEERCAVLSEISKRLSDPDTLELFAQVESSDCGKPLMESRGDIQYCADAFAYYAEIAPSAMADKPLRKEEDGFNSFVKHEAVGVAGLVTPWNFPLMQAVLKVAPALAAGCSVVLKPSPLASLTCSMLGGLARDAGLPGGVYNVVTGGPPGSDTGQHLIDHPELDVLSFTGSGVAGEKMLAASASQLRPTSLELGGKGALVVFEDADIDVAVDWAMVGIFVCAGQVCSATSRLLVHEAIAEEFMTRLQAKASKVVVGNPLEPSTQMGPLVSQTQQDKVLAMIAAAREEGCTVALGGGRARPGAAMEGGYFVEPTILTDVSVDNSAWKEEIFGPVLSVRRFTSEAEAVAATNASPYGLAHAVLSQDTARAARVASQLDAGVVWQNCNQALFVSTPFGGKKASGFGWELGEAGLMEYVSCKTMVQADPGTTWSYYG